MGTMKGTDAQVNDRTMDLGAVVSGPLY